MNLWKFPGQEIGVEMSKLLVFSLFVTSFLPLWVSIIIFEIVSIHKKYSLNYIAENVTTELVMIIAIILLNIVFVSVLMYGLKNAGKTASEELKLVKAKEDKTISAEYLLSYILPLIAFDFAKWDSIILFTVFFITLAFVCLRHNHISLNILLEIMGYSQYDCVLKKEDVRLETERKVISKVYLNSRLDNIVKVSNLNNEMCLIVE